MKKFIQITEKAKSMDLTSETIIKVIQLIEYADNNGIELYVSEKKLRMKDLDVKDSSGSITDDLRNAGKDLFGEDLFGKIFGGKK